MLFYLISASPPYWKDALPKLSDHAKTVPTGLQKVFEKMVAHDRDDRFVNWDAAIEALSDPEEFEDSLQPRGPAKSAKSGFSFLKFFLVIVVLAGLVGAGVAAFLMMRP
jgi:hypothetical protein